SPRSAGSPARCGTRPRSRRARAAATRSGGRSRPRTRRPRCGCCRTTSPSAARRPASSRSTCPESGGNDTMRGIEDVVGMVTKLEVDGICADRFEPVRAAFRDNLDTGQDIGAAVAIFVDGEPVVDLWGGHFDATYTRPFGPDTIVQCFSSTKTITALCALVLADRGEL